MSKPEDRTLMAVPSASLAETQAIRRHPAGRRPPRGPRPPIRAYVRWQLERPFVTGLWLSLGIGLGVSTVYIGWMLAHTLALAVGWEW